MLNALRFIICTASDEYLDPPVFVELDVEGDITPATLTAAKAKAGFADRDDLCAKFWGFVPPERTQFGEFDACIFNDDRERYIVAPECFSLHSREEVDACIARLRAAADSLWPEVTSV